MITITDVQAALISKMKSISDITNLVPPEEIRETQWQGETFTYPNIRASITTETPIGRDECRENNSTVSIYIHVFTEGDSSLACENILSIIKNSLGNKQIPGTTFRSGPVHTQRVVQPIRTAERVWRGTIIEEMNVYT